MGLSAFNRARRLAVEKAAQEAAEAEQQVQEQSDAGITGDGEQGVDLKSPAVPVCAALALINSATNAKGIEKLPTIGVKGAQKIFDVRPEGGFLALEQVAAMVDLQSADWTAIAAWEAPQ